MTATGEPAPPWDDAPVGLVTSTIAGDIVETNRTLRRWLGCEDADLRGTALSGLFDPGGRIFVETRHAQVLHLEGRVEEVSLGLRRSDGARIPVLVSSLLVRPDAADDAAENGAEDVVDGVVQTAVFRAVERVAYERQLLHARRAAEASEARVRVLQDISGTFDVSATERDVVEAFAEVARSAFAAASAAVLLRDDSGRLRLVAGSDPLDGTALLAAASPDEPEGTVVTSARARAEFPSLAEALRAARLEAVSLTPLRSDQEAVGMLVCTFARTRAFDAHFADLQRALGRQAAQTLVRVRLQRRLERLALHDQLTGVANRQSVEQTLTQEVAAAERNGRPLALLFLDVDDFKTVNDRHGHAAGDAVLRALAQRLRAGVRAHDVVGRIGGDEFVVICPGADTVEAESIAGRLLEDVRRPLDAPGGELGVSVSIGVAMYRPGASTPATPDQLLIRADGAMYASKDDGKGRVSVERDVCPRDAE